MFDAKQICQSNRLIPMHNVNHPPIVDSSVERMFRKLLSQGKLKFDSHYRQLGQLQPVYTDLYLYAHLQPKPPSVLCSYQ